jgi:hypothetical protein
MIFSNFDRRTVAAMEIALEAARKGPCGEDHEFRAFVGKSILRCAKRGQKSPGAFTEAAEAAAARWASHDVKQSA